MLAAFRLGKLGTKERAAVEQHVARCDACCKHLEAVQPDALVALLRQADPSKRSAAGAETVGHHDAASQTPAERPEGAKPQVQVPAGLANHARYRVLQVLGTGGWERSSRQSTG